MGHMQQDHMMVCGGWGGAAENTQAAETRPGVWREGRLLIRKKGCCVVRGPTMAESSVRHAWPNKHSSIGHESQTSLSNNERIQMICVSCL